MSETINTEDFQKNKPSGGGCGKVLLWLFFITLISSCLCCAGLCGTGYHIVSSLNKGLVDDPVVTQEKTLENFGEFNLPNYIKPRAFLEVRMFGKYLGFGCIYNWNDDDDAASTELVEISEKKATDIMEIYDGYHGTITFYMVPPEITGGFDDVAADGLSDWLHEPKMEGWNLKRCETVSVTINGQPHDFTFSWMEDVENKPFLMASGFFKTTKETPCSVCIYLPGEPEKESIIKVLENIQK
ncbi:MAG: hypothetical protein IKX40_10195 [Thermoguttaceae bacterium]|nr:hypothetical protein [Thermoguttaceae bacterium]